MFQYAILDAPMLAAFIGIGFLLLLWLVYQARELAIWHPDDRWHSFVDVSAWSARFLIARSERLTKPVKVGSRNIIIKVDNNNPRKLNALSLVFYAAFLVMAFDYGLAIRQYLYTGVELVQYECGVLAAMTTIIVVSEGVHFNHGGAMDLGVYQGTKKIIVLLPSLLIIVATLVYCYTDAFSNTTVMGDLIESAPPERWVADYQSPTKEHSCADDVKHYCEAVLHFDAADAEAVGLTAEDLQDCQKFASEQYQISPSGAVLRIDREEMLPVGNPLEVPLDDLDPSSTVIQQAAMEIQLRSQIKVQEKYRWRARSQAVISVETFDFPGIVKGVVEQTEKQAAAGAFANKSERQAYFASQLQQACAESSPRGIATQTIDCLYDDYAQQWFPARGNLQGLWLELSNKMLS